MALTLEKEMRLTAVQLVAFYSAQNTVWNAAAQQAYTYVKDSFPPGSVIRQDDVVKALEPVLAVNQTLRNRLSEKKLTQKYWVGYFAELIIDRAWPSIST